MEGKRRYPAKALRIFRSFTPPPPRVLRSSRRRSPHPSTFAKATADRLPFIKEEDLPFKTQRAKADAVGESRKGASMRSTLLLCLLLAGFLSGGIVRAEEKAKVQ